MLHAQPFYRQTRQSRAESESIDYHNAHSITRRATQHHHILFPSIQYSQTLHTQRRRRRGTPNNSTPSNCFDDLHTPHESHTSHDSHNFHGTHLSKFKYNTPFPHIPYNNISLTRIYQSQFHYFHTSPHIAPVAPQVIPSLLKGRKRKSNAAGKGGGPKRQRVPAPVVPAPTSTICGVGPTVPATSLLSDGDPPLSSPQLPTLTVQPPTESSQTPSASAHLPATSYRKSTETRKSSSATDVWYFCRASNSEIKPVEPPPDQELTLTAKPRSPFVTCTFTSTDACPLSR